MAADIAPELLEQIKKAAARLENQNALVQAFREKSENKTAKLEDVHGYALGLGESASAALLDVIKSGVLPDDKFYFNIANRTVRPLLADDISAIQDAAAEVQKIIDEENGIGLNSVRADFPESRVAGIIDKLDKSESLDEIREYLGEPIVNLLESSFDGWVQANAESRYQTGLSAIVIRIAHGGACAWCKNLAGTYDYESVRYGSDVWRRHRYCRCVVTYENGKIRQSAWSRKIWQSSPEELERRRNAGNTLFRMTPELLEDINANLERDREVAEREREVEQFMREHKVTHARATRILNKERKRKIAYAQFQKNAEETWKKQTLAERLAERPQMLGAYSPKGLKESLENAGFEVKPLSQGRLKGIPFEEGGGFKVNFGGTGLIQYHPEQKSHHGGAYYKISTGERGLHRYDITGKEKEKD